MTEDTLKGKTAVVTGANCGIGAAVAEALAARGAGVVVSFLRFPPGANKDDPSFPAEYDRQRSLDGRSVAERIRAAGGTAEPLEADLCRAESITRIFDFAEKKLGPVDILVHSASSWLADTFLSTTRDRFGRLLRSVSHDSYERQFAVDARAGALLIAELADRHISAGRNWGRIVALTSGGPDGFPQEVSYGAAKAALENYIKSAAIELSPYGITANLVHPPATDTGWISPEVRAAAAAEGSRIAHPREVAEVVLLLVSDQARYVSGNLLRMR